MANFSMEFNVLELKSVSEYLPWYVNNKRVKMISVGVIILRHAVNTIGLNTSIGKGVAIISLGSHLS